MENYCYHELNRASRFKDASKVKTLGPYAAAMRVIIAIAQMNRKDINTKEFSGNFEKKEYCNLYRGAGMTLEEIKEFQDCAGKPNRDGGGIQLFGYTSCSISKDEALKFAWQNEDSGHYKVLFHIEWIDKNSHYFLNAGAYDHE